MDFELSKDQIACNEKARVFVLENIASFVQKLEEDLDFRLELFKLMSREGYFQLALPQDGKPKDSIAYLLALKEFARIDAGISVAMTVSNMVSEIIYDVGTPTQKKQYLGENVKNNGAPFSFALTEHQAGSDAKKIQTKATREGNNYIIHGEKKYITNADVATVTVVMAKLNDDEDPNITAFLIDKGLPGFSIIKKENKLGLLTANLVGFKCDCCRIPEAQRLGAEGEGFKLALKALDSGRLGVAAQALGIAESAFEAARKFSMEREQFGAPIAKQQAIAFKLADMQVKLSAGELLLFKAAWRKDKGLPYTLEASEAKLYCSEAANQIADEALQIHGGCGYTKDFLVEKYFRDARVTTIYEGTSEIQRLVISREILKKL
ncbi:MAG: acyl-CoA dehydrogenase family protein [Parachlamydiaceae bacterium]|nr:acyl-CoA dehydrogenase family protein [Parachlamydiaceae bacterium]